MNIKDRLVNLKEQLIEQRNIKRNSVNLDDKIEEFLIWYTNNHDKEASKNEKKIEYKKMEDLIEKWAVWYELRYPNYTIVNDQFDKKNIDNIMFSDNQYVYTNFDEESDAFALEWSSLYNAHAFISSLPEKERNIIKKYKYPNIVYLNDHRYHHFHLDNNGVITDCENLYITDKKYKEKISNVKNDSPEDDKYVCINKLFIGKTLKEGYKLLKELNILATDSLKDYDTAKRKHDFLKEEFLDAVLYRIIERGGRIIGPRRGMMFAKEFSRNIEIPMIYGIDSGDNNLRNFINEYIKLGGRTDLECIYNYFFNKDNNYEYDTITISEVLKNNDNYTKEEQELHGKLVNSLTKKQ